MVGKHHLADINPSHLPQITIGMWINMRSYKGNSLGWVFGHDNGGYDRSINLTDSRYNYGVAGGTGQNPHRSSLLNIKENLNSWHCIAASYDQSTNTATFYADGKTQTVPTAVGNGEIFSSLGGLVNFENHTVDALVDEVFIFNRILGSTEIEQVCTDIKKR